MSALSVTHPDKTYGCIIGGQLSAKYLPQFIWVPTVCTISIDLYNIAEATSPQRSIYYRLFSVGGARHTTLVLRRALLKRSLITP